MRVPLLDLKAHHEPLRAKLHAALIRVAESQQFILGPEVDQLEQSMRSYLDCKHAIGVSSGTDALLVALMAIGIQPGDEVIVPTYSFFATAGVVSRLNAKPVFVDVDPVTFNIDPVHIAAHITARTRAIIPVHLYGQAAAMAEINRIAQAHNLIVIEDAAQAIGAQSMDGRRLGTLGHIGCFSFFPSKNLGCFGDAGLVVTSDDRLGDRLRRLRVHGGYPKYYHGIIGGNFRIDALQAAVLNEKFPGLEDWHERRRNNAQLYHNLFTENGLAERIRLPQAILQSTGVKNYHIYNQYVIRAAQRDDLLAFLRTHDVGAEIYYPVPFHRQTCFADMGSNDADFPVANDAAATSLALPIYPELSTEQIQYVVDCIRRFYI